MAGRIQERFYSERDFSLLDEMQRIAARYRQGTLQAALAWLLANPAVTAPIVGANSVEQLQASMAAAGLRLTEEDMQSLNNLSAW